MSRGPDGSSQLFASIERQDSAARVRVVGPNFGEREGPIVTSMIETFVEEQPTVKVIVLDFTDVEFINSSGLGSCVTIHRNATGGKRKVALFGVCPNIMEVFKMTHLHKLFKMVENENALNKLVS